MTSEDESAARDQLWMDRAVARIWKLIWAIGAAGAVALVAWRGWWWGAGWVIGTAVSALNFRWLKQLVEAIRSETDLGDRRRRGRRAGGLARLVVGRRMGDRHGRVRAQLPVAQATGGGHRRGGRQAAQSRVPGHALPAVGRGRLCYSKVFSDQPAGRTFGPVCLGCGGHCRNPPRTGICTKRNCGSLSSSTIIFPESAIR